MARGMLRPLGLSLALMLALSCLLSLALAGPPDKSWKFSDATTKQEALAKATGDADLNAITASDFAADEDPSDNGKGAKGSKKLKSMFADWAQEFGYTFSGQDAKKAFRNFKDNMRDVLKTNLDANTPFWSSGNAYSALSYQEFSAQYLMNSGSNPPADGADNWTPPTGGRKLLQTDKNWVSLGKVTPVRNQGACGSCWAFAATSVIESMYLIKVPGASVSTLNLSEQQLVSCVNSGSGAYNSYGCNGGWSDQAINYVAGINQTTELRYPYKATTGTCNKPLVASSKSGQAVKMYGKAARVSPYNSEVTLMKAVAVAPTVIYFMVDSSFQSYAGGIYVARTCTRSINHAMVAVGYSTSTSLGRFFTIRNSWGPYWGEKGYIRVKMTGDGAGPCGMYQYAYLPPSTFVSSPLI